MVISSLPNYKVQHAQVLLTFISDHRVSVIANWMTHTQLYTVKILLSQLSEPNDFVEAVTVVLQLPILILILSLKYKHFRRKLQNLKLKDVCTRSIIARVQYIVSSEFEHILHL